MINQFSCEYCNATLPVQDRTVLTCSSCGKPCWPAEVKATARSGNKIAAIKVYRFATNSGLKEAKDAVEAFLERGSLEVPSYVATPPQAPVPSPAPQSLEQELMVYIKKNELINAIKLYRERTGVGLREAKDAVEALRDGKPFVIPSSAAPSAVPSATPPPPLAIDIRDQILGLVKQNRLIDAIKLYREKTGVSLLEAKNAIEAVKAGQPLSINIISEQAAPEPANNIHKEIMDAIKAGNKIVAIKVYREHTGVGLKEAKDEIEAVSYGQKQLSLPGVVSPAPEPAKADENEPFRAELLAVMQNEGFISAIRLYRERTGVGLKEGKDFIEALEQDPKAPFPKV